jgi:hypothetical protein
MSVFPSSAMGLPASLKYDLPPSLPDSARSYSVNVAPDGITSVSLTGNVGGASANLFTVNALGGYTGNFGNFTSQMVSFTLPSGTSPSVFLDPVSTTLSFTMQYTVATIPIGGSSLSMNLIGSGASFFDTLIVYSNNIPIETINAYGLLQNFLIANTVNISERYGGLSVSMGCDSNSANGIDLPFNALGTYRMNFTIPLLSVIGANCPDKFFPIGSLNNVQLQLQTANLMPIVSYCGTTAITTQPVINAFSLSEFTLNMKYVDVGDMASQLLAQTLVDGKWFIKCQTYTQSSVTLPANSSGTQQLLLQIRNTSLKSVIHQFGIAQISTAASCPNGYYDAINPGLTSRQLQVGGNYYPNKPINDCGRPSEGYPYLIQALTQGGSIIKSYGTIVNRDTYNMVYPTIPTNSDMACVVPLSGVRPFASGGDNSLTTQLSKWPNSAYYGYDLEKSAGILFQGINSRASPPFLNLFLGASTGSNTILLNAWGISDVILQIDTIAKEVKAFI